MLVKAISNAINNAAQTFSTGEYVGSFGSELIVKSLSFEVEAEDVAGYQRRRQ
jgi:hypothetical protein